MNVKPTTTNTTLPRDAGDAHSRQACLDCLFWYRCKLGRIDCELKD